MDNQIFDLRKALDTSTTNGNNVLSPIILSKAISDWARRQPGLRNAVKRVKATTNTYTWDSVTGYDAAETKADGATLTLMDAQFRQDSVQMSNFYAQGLISNIAIDADQDLV